MECVSTFKDRAERGELNEIDVAIAKIRNDLVKTSGGLVPTNSTITATTISPSLGEVPTISSYWENIATRELFKPAPDESAVDCLDRRIELFYQVENDCRLKADILEGGEEALEELNDIQKGKLGHDCRFLRKAYEIALVNLGKGDDQYTWLRCCEEAIKEIN